MADPVVLILGCGVSGVVAARRVRQLLPAQYRVIVIDREPVASYSPAYLWVMTGERKPEALRRNRGRLARHAIEFVNAEVRQIDVDERYVRADSREFHYDYLVLALGGEAQHTAHSEAHSLDTLEAAERLAAGLRYFSGGRILIAAGRSGFRYPPQPYEIALLLEDYFHRRRVRQKVIVSVYTPEEAPLAVLGARHSDELRSLLAHRGIELQAGKCLATVDGARHVAAMADGEEAGFQMLITEPQFQLPPVLYELGLADGSGRVPVDPATMETARRNVFAVGDLTYLTLLGGGELPRAPGFAVQQGRTVASVIGYRAGRGPRPDPFDAKARWIIETGGGAAMMAEGDFLAPQQIVLRQPSRLWHMAGLALEKRWLWRSY